MLYVAARLVDAAYVAVFGWTLDAVFWVVMAEFYLAVLLGTLAAGMLGLDWVLAEFTGTPHWLSGNRKISRLYGWRFSTAGLLDWLGWRGLDWVVYLPFLE